MMAEDGAAILDYEKEALLRVAEEEERRNLDPSQS